MLSKNQEVFGHASWMRSGRRHSTCGYNVPFKNTRGNKHKLLLYREAGNTALRQSPPLLSVSLVYYI